METEKLLMVTLLSWAMIVAYIWRSAREEQRELRDKFPDGFQLGPPVAHIAAGVAFTILAAAFALLVILFGGSR